MGRLDPFHPAHALGLRLHPDVRHRRPHRPAARLQPRRPPPARHLLRDWALPLRRRAGHPLRPLRRGLSLVSKNHRSLHERLPLPRSFLAQPHLHEHHLLPHAHPGHGRLPPPLVQRRRRLPRQGHRRHRRWSQRFCQHRRAEHRPEHLDVLRCMDSRRRADPVRHQSVLLMENRSQGGERQPMERYHPRVGDPDTASSRQLHLRRSRLPRPLRIFPPGLR